MSVIVSYSAFLAEFKSNIIRKLRPAQEAALSAYSSHFGDVADVGLELPTGAGKSLIALLVAEAWRQNSRTVSILSANKALAADMKLRGSELGIPVSLLAGSDIPGGDVRRISRGRSIGIMNYWVYFNQNPALDPTDLVIFDDVHLADGALQSLFSVSVTRREHSALFSRLADALVEALPGYPAIRDAAAGSGDPLSPTDLVAPHDHREVIGTVSDLINAADRPRDLNFRWSRLRSQVERLHLYVAADEIILRPYVWPLQELDHYRASKQRIYLSATLGSPSDLQRRLGCRAIQKIPVADADAKPLGRRFVVLNRQADQQQGRAAVNAALKATHKGLWLTPSHSQADDVERLLQESNDGPVWRLSSTGDETDEFAVARQGHLVAAGRYDGIDLPGDACRLVVLTRMPRAVDLQETFLSEQLRDATFLRERLNARILQALGRANRSKDDFAVYVLADPRFSAHLQRDANRASLPALINAEIDVAQDLAEEGEKAVARAVRGFLAGRTRSYDETVAEAVNFGPPAVTARDDVTAEHEVEGWRRMNVGDFSGAEACFSEWAAVCQASDRREQAAFALVNQARAALMVGGASGEARARSLVERAVRAGGMRSTWFNGLRASITRLATDGRAPPSGEAADRILSAFDQRALATGGSRARFERERARTALQLSTGNHSQFQEGMEELGRLLGLDAIRPKGTGVADIRWQWSEGGRRQLLVWEAKINHRKHKALAVRDVDQANGQLTQARGEHGPRGVSCYGALVSQLPLDAGAKDRLGEVAVVHRDAVAALWERVAGIFGRYVAIWHPDDAEARRQAVGDVEGSLPPTRWLTRALEASSEIGVSELLGEWP